MLAPVSVTALNHGGGFNPTHGESKGQGDQGFGLAGERRKNEGELRNGSDLEPNAIESVGKINFHKAN
jgi:hypothetical protein